MLIESVGFGGASGPLTARYMPPLGGILYYFAPNIVKTSPDLRKQLGMFYDNKLALSILSRTMSFRLMHLPGRALVDLISKAVNNLNDYYWMESYWQEKWWDGTLEKGICTVKNC